MANIIQMNSARQLNILHKMYQWPVWGVKSYMQLIDEGRFLWGEQAEVPKIKYDRRKYNRMNWGEQREYDKQLELLVTEYRLYTSETDFFPVPKMIYDYYTSLKHKAQ